MLFATGLTGAGKSTIARTLAARYGARLYDMDAHYPPEWRQRHRSGDVPSAAEIYVLQTEHMIPAMLTESQRGLVVVAGFFLSQELAANFQAAVPGGVHFLNLAAPYDVLAGRIMGRTGHFAGLSVLDANWPDREGQRLGRLVVDACPAVDVVTKDCLAALAAVGQHPPPLRRVSGLL